MPHHDGPLREALQEELKAAIPYCSRLVVLEFLLPKTVQYVILGAMGELSKVWYICVLERNDKTKDLPEYRGPVPVKAQLLAGCGVIVPDCYSSRQEDFPTYYVSDPGVSSAWMELVNIFAPDAKTTLIEIAPESPAEKP